MKEKDNKKNLLFILLLLLIIALIGGYLVFNNKKEDSRVETSVDEEITVESGDLVKWPSERKEFYIPINWESSRGTDDNFNEYITLTNTDITLQMEYQLVKPDYMWSRNENIEYSASQGLLYKENGNYKAALNTTITKSHKNFDTGEESEDLYALFITIKRQGEPVSDLSEKELAQVKFVIDSYSAD